jgi:hypothetical protein
VSELLSIRGVRAGQLLDEPLLLSAAGDGAADGLRWRARYRDDDLRVWRAVAGRAEDLLAALEPAKPSSGPIAALASLRPVRIDARVEAGDGRAAGRAVTRLVVAEGVRVRRWRFGGLAAVLHLPAAATGCATVVVDGTAGANAAVVAGLAGPLLASRGTLVLCVTAGPLDDAIEALASVPGSTEPVVATAADPLGSEPASDSVPLPPGVGVRGEPEGGAAARAAAWDALLARLGATPRLSRQSAHSG